MTNSIIKTTLYAASVLPLKDAKLYRLAYNTASAERRQKVDKYRFEKDRCLSLGADMLMRYVLRKENVAHDYVRIKMNAFGKPYFEDINLYFNISHSEDWVICAISDAEVGCDIEKIQSADLHIAEHHFCAEEYLHICQQASEAKREYLFYRYWTLKESFIKAAGKGMSIPLNAFRIELGDIICIKQSVDQRKYSFAEFGDISGYCCAVCSVGGQQEASLKVVDYDMLYCDKMEK